MKMIKENYPKFSPISNEMYVSLGSASQYDQTQTFFGGELMVAIVLGREQVFKKIIYTQEGDEPIEKAKKIIQAYTSYFQIEELDFFGGCLCNENSEFIGKLGYHGKLLAEKKKQNQ